MHFPSLTSTAWVRLLRIPPCPSYTFTLFYTPFLPLLHSHTLNFPLPSSLPNLSLSYCKPFPLVLPVLSIYRFCALINLSSSPLPSATLTSVPSPPLVTLFPSLFFPFLTSHSYAFPFYVPFFLHFPSLPILFPQLHFLFHVRHIPTSFSSLYPFFFFFYFHGYHTLMFSCPFPFPFHFPHIPSLNIHPFPSAAFSIPSTPQSHSGFLSSFPFLTASHPHAFSPQPHTLTPPSQYIFLSFHKSPPPLLPS